MSTDMAGMLERERKRAKVKPVENTREERARRRLMGRFHDVLRHVWDDANLLTDDELVWLSAVTDAAKVLGTRKYRRFSGEVDQVLRATNYDDTKRLEELRSELYIREWARSRTQALADGRAITQALSRLGLPVPDFHTARLKRDKFHANSSDDDEE